MGADEYDAKGLNRGWFTDHASKAHADDPMHAIYATSWKRDGGNFPMVWSPKSASVGGVNVTASYTAKAAPADVTIGVRFFEGDDRSVRKGSLTTEAGFVLANFETKAGTADLNDTPHLVVTPEKTYRLRFDIDGNAMETAPFKTGEKDMFDIRAVDLTIVPDFNNEDAPLSENDATRAIAFTYETMLAEQKEKRAAELKAYDRCGKVCHLTAPYRSKASY